MEKDSWVQRAEDIADRYAAALNRGNLMSSDFHTIVISIPKNKPHEGLHQAVKDYASGHGMSVEAKGYAYFLRDRAAPSAGEILAEPQSHGRLVRMTSVPLMLAIDEADLMEASGG